MSNLTCFLQSVRGLIALAFVMAQLGPGPNKGSVVIVTGFFLTVPRVFCLVRPCVVFPGIWYKLVELMCSPQVSVQQGV
jgi:hypothetical protein